MKLNKTNFQIRFKRGLAANIRAYATEVLGLQGEPHYTTDTKRLYIHDGTGNVAVPTLDMAVVSSGAVVTNGGEIVWQS